MKSGIKQKFFFDVFCDTTACNKRNLNNFVNTYVLYDSTSASVSNAPNTSHDSVQISPGLAIRVFPS